jgi:serine/threonine protein kinase
MPPEQFDSDKPYSYKVDIWALGVLFDELLFNELFFYEENLCKLINMIYHTPYFVKDTPIIS